MSEHYPDKQFRKEFAGLMIGELIHTGSSRTVYRMSNLPYVIKMEHRGTWQNMREWTMWQDAKGTPLEKWLAPCYAAHYSGKILIQALTKPIVGRTMPEKIPAVLTDLKIQNWGWYEDRPVCHDYGTNYAIEMVAKADKQKKADWWDEITGEYIKDRSKVKF